MSRYTVGLYVVINRMLITTHRPGQIIVCVGVGLRRVGQSPEQIVWRLVVAGISGASRGELETGSVARLGLRHRRVNAAWPGPLRLSFFLPHCCSLTPTLTHTYTHIFCPSRPLPAHTPPKMCVSLMEEDLG